ncbi:MAG: SEC-C metal-binding domain-containing protein, partial [Solirubrobacteraceae bacterium]
QYFLQRKHTLEYDDVLNQQREVVYTYRDEVLEGRDMSAAAREQIVNLIDRIVEEYTSGEFVEDWDLDGLMRRIEEIYIPSDDFELPEAGRLDREDLTVRLQEEALTRYDDREEELGEELMRHVERYLLLEIIDQRWQEHLYDMDYLQHGIGLRGLAQMDPLVAYKNEAYELFQDLMNSVWSDFARLIYHVEVTIHDADGQPMPPQPPRHSASSSSSSSTGGGRVTYSGGQSAAGAMAMAAAAGAEPGEAYEEGGPPPEPVQQRVVDEAQQTGRNDPCWCGSGKKYKKCHGA